MYSVETDVDASPEVAALPPEALADYAELRVFLETTPLNADLLNPRRAGANMRSISFGPRSLGLVVFYVLEDQRRVVIVRVLARLIWRAGPVTGVARIVDKWNLPGSQ